MQQINITLETIGYLIFAIACVVFVSVIFSEDRKRTIVKENSEYLHAVRQLNERTDYHKSLGSNGTFYYTMNVKSKAKYDKTVLQDALYEYLRNSGQEVAQILSAVAQNRKTEIEYNAAFAELHSVATETDCKNWKIKYDKFRKIEAREVNALKLDIITEVCVCCKVEYTSPQGRKHYEKDCRYLESEIRVAIKDIERQAEYRASETYRRKTERAKVSPKLRLAVLQRDGFRCRYCGRSAANGVELEVDHIIPISQNGMTVMSNLQTLCMECNRGKGSQKM